MTARLLAAALLPLALAGASKHDPLAGRIAQAPVDCVDSQFVSGPMITDDRQVIYYSPGKLYRAEVVGRCPTLEPVSTLIVEAKIGSQICKDDMFRVLRPGETIPSQYCRFGRFTPFVKPKG